jgi:transposase
MIRSILVARSRLVGIRRDIENQVRSMINEYGLLFGRAIGSQFRKHVTDVLGEGHQLHAIIEPLLSIHEQVCLQQNHFDNEVRRFPPPGWQSRHHPRSPRLRNRRGERYRHARWRASKKESLATTRN